MMIMILLFNLSSTTCNKVVFGYRLALPQDWWFPLPALRIGQSWSWTGAKWRERSWTRLLKSESFNIQRISSVNGDFVKVRVVSVGQMLHLTVGQVLRANRKKKLKWWINIKGATPPHCGEPLTRKTSPGASANDWDGDQRSWELSWRGRGVGRNRRRWTTRGWWSGS